jgi:hypothetical protein
MNKQGRFNPLFDQYQEESLMSDARLKANPDLKAAKRFMGKLTALSDLPSDSELIALIQEAITRKVPKASPLREVISASASSMLRARAPVPPAIHSDSARQRYRPRSVSPSKLLFVRWVTAVERCRGPTLPSTTKGFISGRRVRAA